MENRNEGFWECECENVKQRLEHAKPEQLFSIKTQQMVNEDFQLECNNFSDIQRGGGNQRNNPCLEGKKSCQGASHTVPFSTASSSLTVVLTASRVTE